MNKTIIVIIIVAGVVIAVLWIVQNVLGQKELRREKSIEALKSMR